MQANAALLLVNNRRAATGADVWFNRNLGAGFRDIFTATQILSK
jgi:hypothetical protein